MNIPGRGGAGSVYCFSRDELCVQLCEFDREESLDWLRLSWRIRLLEDFGERVCSCSRDFLLVDPKAWRIKSSGVSLDL